jgi:hypothetical protein
MIIYQSVTSFNIRWRCLILSLCTRYDHLSVKLRLALAQFELLWVKVARISNRWSPVTELRTTQPAVDKSCIRSRLLCLASSVPVQVRAIPNRQTGTHSSRRKCLRARPPNAHVTHLSSSLRLPTAYYPGPTVVSILERNSPGRDSLNSPRPS